MFLTLSYWNTFLGLCWIICMKIFRARFYTSLQAMMQLSHDCQTTKETSLPDDHIQEPRQDDCADLCMDVTQSYRRILIMQML